MYLLKVSEMSKDLGLSSVVISVGFVATIKSCYKLRTLGMDGNVSEKKSVLEDTVKTTLLADPKFKNEEHLHL